jgi:hypothetical protein
MRRYFPFVLVAVWSMATAVGTAQPASREKAIADYYWRNGHYQAAMFYVELQEAREKKKPEDKKEPAKPATLEQLIAEALKSNPDIRVAEAKMNEVTAELDRVRVKITADVAALFADISAAEASMREGADRHERAFNLLKQKAISEEEYGSAKLAALKLRLELEALQRKLPYLLGRQKATEKDTAKASSPEQLIAEALKNNSDVRVAEAKARESAAQLDRTRLKVASDISAIHADIQAAQAALDYGKLRYDRMKYLGEKGVVEARVVDEAERAFIKAKRDLPSVEAKLPYLIGRPAGASGPSGAERPPHPQSPLHDKLRKALDTEGRFPASLHGASLVDLMEWIRDSFRMDINTVIRVKSKKIEKVNVQLEKAIPLGAFFQYLEDELDVVFILRDYGIVVVAADERLPPGAMRVVDFWKLGNARESKVESKDKK